MLSIKTVCQETGLITFYPFRAVCTTTGEITYHEEYSAAWDGRRVVEERQSDGSWLRVVK